MLEKSFGDGSIRVPSSPSKNISTVVGLFSWNNEGCITTAVTVEFGVDTIPLLQYLRPRCDNVFYVVSPFSIFLSLLDIQLKINELNVGTIAIATRSTATSTTRTTFSSTLFSCQFAPPLCI